MHTHKEIGIYSYLSFSPGIGGKLKKSIDDFHVEELPKELAKDEHGNNLILKVRLRNWETNRFVKLLSKRLGMSRNRIRFAGTKDKRSVSTQYFCIYNLSNPPEINMKDVEIIDAFRSNVCIELGDLLGNKFRIFVSDATCQNVEKIEDELDGKFPNFFGVQRFGAARPTTHIVGKYIVQGNYREAVRYYIGLQSEYKEDDGRKIFWNSLDPRAAIREIDPRAEYERAMLNHLIKNPDDYAGAIRALPKTLAMMFVHAYQSYLFNKMVSERLNHGVQLELGDVVTKVDSHGIPTQEYVKVSSFNYDKIKKLESQGRVYISTILFGYESSFSEGIQGTIERRIIKDESITPMNFRIKDIPELSSKGRRRNILARFYSYTRNGCEFSFILSPGTYATSLMREFMKQEALEYY